MWSIGVRWRHHLHSLVETGFNEVRTADDVASVLTAPGLEDHGGIGGTGMVAKSRVGAGHGAIVCARAWMLWQLP